MTGYGKLNLACVATLPVVAVLAAVISFGLRTDMMVAVFAINCIPMVLGGLVSALLLRGANRVRAGQWIALWPTLIPAVIGAVWYLWRAIFPEEVAPGREHVAAPQYLLLGVIVLGLVAWIGCRIARASRSSG